MYIVVSFVLIIPVTIVVLILLGSMIERLG